MKRQLKDLRERLGHIIFETNTPAAKLFDVVLLWTIFISVVLVMLESVPSFRRDYGMALRTLEWAFTIIFTLEYLARIFAASNRRKYIRSFYGIVDLLAILPSYLSLILTGAQYLLIVRSLRLLRVFRVLKLVRFLGEASTLARALRASREKITVFLVTVATLVVIIGSVMFLVEGEEHGFSNIPISVYWAIVTLTTVGYGDIAPKTPLGQFFSAIVMILGYGIIAVPTGIVSVELARAERDIVRLKCTNCQYAQHDVDAKFCKRCGEAL
jgi:voltage-gated potassium channel